jgi:type II secretory pathway pseudopilin PulG
MKTTMTKNTRRAARAGFTLAEVLISAVLMALGFVALLAAFGQDSVSTQRGEDVTAAAFLADEIRDMALQMSFADVLNLNNVTYPDAILSTGALAGRTGWSQHVTVLPVSATNLNQSAGWGTAGAARLTVDVRNDGHVTLTQTYYIFNMDGVPFTDSSG